MSHLPPIDRQTLIAEARAIIELLDRGGYAGPTGHVDVQPELARLTVGTRHYSAAETHALGALPAPQQATRTQVTVTRETTLAAAQRLLTARPSPVAVLNFASATTPGGGFLTGSAAQEESLARSSGLYHALRQHPEYYAAHQGFGDRLYSDRMLFSRDVPVFRDADGHWLDRPWHLDILTAAAPNLRRLTESEVSRITPEAQAALALRAELVLSLFAHHRCTRLVLGAWGCGAFRNDPDHVASVFARLLNTSFQGVFDEVVFAVFATPAEERNVVAFERQLLR